MQRRGKPHILMLVANAGTKDARVRREAEALVASGRYKVSVACTQPKGTANERVNGVRYVRIPIARGFHLPLWWKAYKTMLWKDPLLLLLAAIAILSFSAVLAGFAYALYMGAAFLTVNFPRLLAAAGVGLFLSAVVLRYLLYPLFIRPRIKSRLEALQKRRERFVFKVKRRLRIELRQRVYMMDLIFSYGTFFKTMMMNVDRHKPVYDIVHAHDLNTMLAGVTLKRRFNAKLVFDAHELAAHEDDRRHILRRRFKRLIMRRLAPEADRIITVSRGFDRWFSKKFKKPVLIVYNTPQIARRTKLTETVRSAAGLSKEAPLIGYIGGITERRGSKQLGQALRIIPDNYTVVFVSGAKQKVRDQIAMEATRNPLPGYGAKIIWLPPVQAAEVVHFMQDADITLAPRLPPRNHLNPQREYSMPNKLFESTFAGVPIVGGDSIELTEFVNKYKVGMAANCHDPEDIARKIKDLYIQREKFQKTDEEIAAIYAEYGWPTMARNLVNFYDDMLET